MFGDIVQAFAIIETTLRVLPKEVVNDDINELTSKIRSTLHIVVNSYEEADYPKVQEIFQFNLMPKFNKWKKRA